MKAKFVKKLMPALGVIALGLSSSFAIASSTWRLDLCTLSSLGSVGSGCISGTDVNGNSVHAYAFSVSNASASEVFASATLAQYGTSSGLGVYDGTSPEHALDNKGSTELIALRFDTAVELEKITFGWTSSDRDISLFSLKNGSSPVVIGSTIANLSSSWQLVGNYGDGAPDSAYSSSSTDRTISVNSNNLSSSWWLLSAYNKNYDTSKPELDNVTDYVKVMSVAGVTRPPTNETPEPGSLVLFGAGLFGLMALRRRRQIKH